MDPYDVTELDVRWQVLRAILINERLMSLQDLKMFRNHIQTFTNALTTRIDNDIRYREQFGRPMGLIPINLATPGTQHREQTAPTTPPQPLSPRTTTVMPAMSPLPRTVMTPQTTISSPKIATVPVPRVQIPQTITPVPVPRVQIPQLTGPQTPIIPRIAMPTVMMPQIPTPTVPVVTVPRPTIPTPMKPFAITIGRPPNM